MIEKQSINGREIWLKVDPHRVQRSNPNVIPKEYFTASYFLNEPIDNSTTGEVLKDEDGQPKLFESLVAALTFTRKKLETTI